MSSTSAAASSARVARKADQPNTLSYNELEFTMPEEPSQEDIFHALIENLSVLPTVNNDTRDLLVSVTRCAYCLAQNHVGSALVIYN